MCRHVLTIAPLSLLLFFVRRKEEGKKEGCGGGKKSGKKCCITTQKVWCREISKEGSSIFCKEDRIRFLIKGNKWKIKKENGKN